MMVESNVMLNKTFRDLNLDTWLIDRCEIMGIHHPTPVQHYCIPKILDGQDCIGCSHTGSGKTLAFALPILHELFKDPYGIYALILTPGRELVLQIAEQFRVIGKSIGLQVCVIIGGMDMVIQGKELAAKPHIVIATPGRLADHLESCDTFTLKKIKFLVLDEADRLLGGSFTDQLQVIFDALPKKRQTLLFTATNSKSLEESSVKYTKNPFLWLMQAETATVGNLDQRYVLTPKAVRDANLVHVIHQFLEKDSGGAVIVFTNTCRWCQLLSVALNNLGFENMALNSLLLQKERLAALAQFRSKKVKILVATDVASRGLDIPTVELVINHMVPFMPDDYIHRVGRTARAGRGGIAITLVTQYDVKLIHAIEERINTKLVLHKTKEKEMIKILVQVNVAIREAQISLEEMDTNEKVANYKRKKLILEGKDPDAEEELELKKAKRKRKRLKAEAIKKLRRKERC